MTARPPESLVEAAMRARAAQCVHGGCDKPYGRSELRLCPTHLLERHRKRARNRRQDRMRHARDERDAWMLALADCPPMFEPTLGDDCAALLEAWFQRRAQGPVTEDELQVVANRMRALGSARRGLR